MRSSYACSHGQSSGKHMRASTHTHTYAHTDTTIKQGRRAHKVYPNVGGPFRKGQHTKGSYNINIR